MTERTKPPATPSTGHPDPDRVRALIDAYGADPGRWPADERETALALLSREPELARHAEEARALDGLLDAVAHPDSTSAPSTALKVRLKDIPDRRGLLGWIVDAIGVWRPATGLVTAGLMGIAVGVTVPELTDPRLVPTGVAETAIAETVLIESTITDDGAPVIAHPTDTLAIAAAHAFGFASHDHLH